MDAELLKAIKAVVRLNDSLCKVDDNDLHMELTDRFSESLDTLEIKLTATVAEYRKRRAESPWKGPFRAIEGTPGLCDSRKSLLILTERHEYTHLAVYAAALNAYYGYGAQGNDMLEGIGV